MADRLDFRVKQGLLVTTTATIEGTTNSSSTTTGALIVAGGVGVRGNIYVGGDIVAQRLIIEYTTVTTQLIQTDDVIQTTNTTSSVSTTTGALKISGGAGIGGNVYVGGTLNVTGEITGNASSADQVKTTAATAATTHYLSFVDSNNASATNENIYTTSSFSITPSTGNVSIGGTLNVTGAITGVITTSTNLSAGVPNAIVYQSNTGTTAYLAPAQIGYILQTNGTGSAPSWVPLSGTTAGAATTATNLAGGTAGSVPYQNNTGTTLFVAPGTSGTVFVSNGTSAPSWNNTLALAGTTAASSTTTGALTVVGGVGVGGNVYVGGTLNVTGEITGNASSASQVKTTAATAATTHYISFVDTNNASATNETVYTTSSFSITPSTGNVSIGGTLSVTGAITGNISSANQVKTTAATATTTHYLSFVDTNNASATNETVYTTSSFSITPSTGNVSIGGTLNVTGAITGNVSSADQVKTITTTTAALHYVTFVDANNASSTNERLLTTSSFSINPGTNEVTVTGSILYNNTQLANYTSSAITSTTTQNLDSFPHATYRSAKYIAQVTLGTNYQFSEFGVLHNGTTVYLNEYGIMTTAGQFGTFDAIITGTNLVITWTANTTTSHVVKLSRIAITS